MERILNISGYKFVTLYNIYTLREWLKPVCISLGIKGTITLSIEGINIGIAGKKEAINTFIKTLHCDGRFSDIEFKESWSDEMPFRNFHVKCKKRIVPAVLRVDATQSFQHLLPAKQLKAWLDHDEDVVLVDTRNDYEIEYGTFKGARHYNLKQFSQIYDAFKTDESLKDKKVVMFCTGGIRCEKGIPLAKAAGLKEVYHLEGGILKYFEECQGAHYEGGCYVFDQRVAVDPELKPMKKTS